MGTGSIDLIIDTEKIFRSLPVKGDTRTPDVYGGGFFEETLDEKEESDIEVEYSDDEALDENEEECVY